MFGAEIYIYKKKKKKKKKYQSFLSEQFQFLEVNFSIYLNRRVFVMASTEHHIEKRANKTKLNRSRNIVLERSRVKLRGPVA